MNRHYGKRYCQDLDIKELIKQYKRYPCLWDYNSPDYKYKTSKQEAWEEIANYFQKDADEVKRKVKYLRSAYVGEKKKVDASRKTETPYKPSLFYYNELNFLDHIVVLRKCGTDSDNIDYDLENTTISRGTEDEEFVAFENVGSIDHTKSEISCKVEDFPESEPEIQFPTKTQPPKILSSRSLASRPVKRKVSGEIKPNKSVSSKDKYKNLYISFGKTISLQLQQLPLEIAILAMSEIQAILTQKTLEHIKYLPKAREQSLSHSESEDSFSALIEENFTDSS